MPHRCPIGLVANCDSNSLKHSSMVFFCVHPLVLLHLVIGVLHLYTGLWFMTFFTSHIFLKGFCFMTFFTSHIFWKEGFVSWCSSPHRVLSCVLHFIYQCRKFCLMVFFMSYKLYYDHSLWQFILTVHFSNSCQLFTAAIDISTCFFAHIHQNIFFSLYCELR